MVLIKICNKVIEYSFYGLFLLVPLVFTSATSELFELNKMWLTWALTIVIVMAWIIKMVIQRRIRIQRTPLDIPIILFLSSQIISTIFSLDFHVSLWGYYSRFNGGLLSIISYILLYYAFLSNFVGDVTAGGERGGPRRVPAGSASSEDIQRGQSETAPARMVKRLLFLSLISGLIVALWGLPSHFGYDPTCFLFRGTFDVSCWTADFVPKARIFSTLGQPNWLAAYLAILIPIAIAFWFQKTQNTQKSSKPEPLTVRRSESLTHRVIRVFWKPNFYLLLITLFYVDLLFTQARSGILALWASLAFFFLAYIFIERKRIASKLFNLATPLFAVVTFILVITFIIGVPIPQIYNFTLPGRMANLEKDKMPSSPETSSSNDQNSTQAPVSQSVTGGTESGDIRLNVWQGSINAWKNNPIFGTGVETFAYAYYKYKPIGQNLTSEWNFLYNKAHNEYLNYLATTGIVGLGGYLFMIGTFLFMTIKKLLFSENSEHSENQKLRQSDNLNVRKSGIPSFPSILNIALLASYISILITNFFGFSVVITNIYLFMIPAFVFALTTQLPNTPTTQNKPITHNSQPITGTSIWQWTPIFFVSIIGWYILIMLFRFWLADIAYALGYNLDRAGEYQQAYPNLHKAVELRGDEPVFKDELSINDAIIAAGLLAQQTASDQKQQAISVASSLAQEAINTSNEIVSKSPNNAVFWKTRTRVFYTLSQVDSRYLPRALDAIEKGSLLAPQDANIWYNLGVLYGQSNNIKKGAEALEKTVKLKPDYRDAHYALGLFYHTASLDEKGKIVINSALQKKAIYQMQYILDHIAPQDPGALESIKSWGE